MLAVKGEVAIELSYSNFLTFVFFVASRLKASNLLNTKQGELDLIDL